MKKNANFLMSPTVDYCFKELLAYPEIRKGFVAAVLNKAPEEIKETILMPTILSKDSEDGKYGILDVCVKLWNGSQMDLEMQVILQVLILNFVRWAASRQSIPGQQSKEAA